MKIAFTHNIQLSNSEDEAEFDTPKTIAAITNALRALGHEVEPIDVAGPASRVVARLEALNPDLVFNTAEGQNGRFREAFFPALFDRLGIPFTGSDAYVCALTLDKQLTKMIVKSHDIKTPTWYFIENVNQITDSIIEELNFPVIVKPNYEGSSMGITTKSIIEEPLELKTYCQNILPLYPAGLLIEEFIIGRDITVPFLELASPTTKGILEPAEYIFDDPSLSDRKYQIYDYDLKSAKSDAVKVKTPSSLTSNQKKHLTHISQKVVKALGIRDAARVDYRLGNDGELYFIEVNALPSLEPGASIYESAALAGLNSIEKVIGTITQSAADRFNLSIANLKNNKKTNKLKVGLTYNLKRTNNSLDNGGVDIEAEFDSPETIYALKEAIESYGHKVIELEATAELPSILPSSGIDIAFNVAEGISGRTRESQVPAMLELLGIPCTGSDTTTLALALDKALAKRLVLQAGISTPPFLLMSTGKERLPKSLTFPVIIKPNAEGSSKGIISTSVIESEEELRILVSSVSNKYKQSVLVESYLPGREFTVALLGEKRPRALPPLEVVFTNNSSKHKLYSFESKFFNQDIKFEVPAKIDAKLNKDLERIAKNVFSILDCRDLARVDLRLDEKGVINFIECNPLPGLTPNFSDFCVIAEAAGMSYRTLVGEIMAPAIRRFKENRKEKLLQGRF